MTVIIAGFPGVGKSHLVKSRPDLNIWDSDSSQFSKEPDFPQNYINHLKSGIKQEVDIILVSTHEVVRDALREANISFYCVLPWLGDDIKDEYIERYKERGSSEAFIKLISDNWELWLDNIAEKEYWQISIDKGEYLSDVIDDILFMEEDRK
jgi:hypothetical protein